MMFFMIAVVFIGSFVQGLLGFGFGLIAIPALSLILGPKHAIAICMFLGFLNNIGMSVSLRKHVTIRRFIPLIITGLATVPFGSFLLYSLDPNHIKMVLGVVIVLTCLGYFFGLSFTVKREKTGLALVGLVSGTLAGCIGIGGPPIIFFLTNQKEEKMSFKANLVIYFFLLGLVLTPSYFYAGLMTVKTIEESVILFAPMVLGMIAGSLATRYVPQSIFTRLVLVCLMSSGAMLIGSVLTS